MTELSTPSFKTIQVSKNNGFESIIIPGVRFSTGSYKPFNEQDSKVKRLTVYITVKDEEMAKELASLGFTIYDNSKSAKNGEPIEHWIIVKFSKDTTLYNLTDMVKQVVQFVPEHPNFAVDNTDVALTVTKDSKTGQIIRRLSAYKYYPAKVSTFSSDLFGDDKDFAQLSTGEINHGSQLEAPSQDGLF